MFLEVAGFIVGLLGIVGVILVWAIWKEEKKQAERDAIEEAKVRRIKEKLINDKLEHMHQRIMSLEQGRHDTDKRVAIIYDELDHLRAGEDRR